MVKVDVEKAGREKGGSRHVWNWHSTVLECRPWHLRKLLLRAGVSVMLCQSLREPSFLVFGVYKGMN